MLSKYFCFLLNFVSFSQLLIKVLCIFYCWSQKVQTILNFHIVEDLNKLYIPKCDKIIKKIHTLYCNTYNLPINSGAFRKYESWVEINSIPPPSPINNK
jgi:hypothetical protein